jgi:1-phosphofructokinase family hexose kinase
MILCVAGNPAVDKLFEIDSISVGSIHRPLGLVTRPGGKGLNVACAAGRLGAEVTAAGLLGGHAGRWVQEALAAEPIDGRFVWTSAETRSSLSVADRRTHQLTEFYEQSPPIQPRDWEALVSLVGGLVPRARWITVSGTLPPGAPTGAYRPIIRAARAAGIPVAVDARGATLADVLCECPTLVKINASEAAEVLGVPVEDPDSALNACLRIREMIGGDGHGVGVTLGEIGAVMVDPSGVAQLVRLDVLGAYPVGSGDAFLAGMVVGLEQGERWHEAARLAMGAAAANAEVPGVGVLDPGRARDLAERTILEPLGNFSASAADRRAALAAWPASVSQLRLASFG